MGAMITEVDLNGKTVEDSRRRGRLDGRERGPLERWIAK
jgi:hypothetical protein